jgi:hypothetical protein
VPHPDLTQLTNFRTFNDGKHAAIVRCIGSTRFWITSAVYAQTLNKEVFTILQQTAGMLNPLAPSYQQRGLNQMHSEPAVKPPMAQVPVSNLGKATKIHIRRPRNQFIIYRQWMSAKIHANNPGITAGCICTFLFGLLFWGVTDTS